MALDDFGLRLPGAEEVEMARYKTITFDIPADVVRGLLLTAVESNFGSGWFQFSDIERDSEGYILKARVTDIEADKPRTFTVTPLTMAIGLQNLGKRMVKSGPHSWSLSGQSAARHFAAAISEDGDSITADVVLQMAVFGEVLYG